MYTAINSLVPVSPLESKIADVRRWIYGIAWHMVTRVKGQFASKIFDKKRSNRKPNPTMLGSSNQSPYIVS